jgi:nitroimidazol reductase NimA-like FMN-containing flavoprotein (pyridoxamine 5'-phosphate oxidase superfamily)
MRANPLVCVKTEELTSSEEWVSIIVLGRYEGLPDTPEWRTAREVTYALLQQKASWCEPGYSKTIVQGVEHPLVPVYFRIQIMQVTGRRGTPEAASGTAAKSKHAASS